MQQTDFNVSYPNHIVGVVRHKILGADSRRAFDPFEFLVVSVDGDLDLSQQLSDTCNLSIEQQATQVVGVMMSRDHRGETHPVVFQEFDDLGGSVGRIDYECLAAVAVTDQVSEVRHLVRHMIVTGEVLSGTQLSKIELIHRHDSRASGTQVAKSARRTSLEKTSTIGMCSPIRLCNLSTASS